MWRLLLGPVRRIVRWVMRDQQARDLSERDAPADLGEAETRAEGGVPHPSAPDTHSTTGTTPHGEFVGRASGDDPGEVEDSGPAEPPGDERRRSEER